MGSAEERPFKEKIQKPTIELLKTALSANFKSYEALMTLSKAFKQEWNFSKSSGWIQKVSDSKKALFYFIPLSGSYKVGLTVREEEREQMLGDEAVKFIHPVLLTAKKYSEGYAVHFLVKNSDDANICNKFIRRLIVLR